MAAGDIHTFRLVVPTSRNDHVGDASCDAPREEGVAKRSQGGGTGPISRHSFDTHGILVGDPAYGVLAIHYRSRGPRVSRRHPDAQFRAGPARIRTGSRCVALRRPRDSIEGDGL